MEIQSLKQRLFSNWHLVRIVRLAIGLWLLIAGIQMHEWLSGMFSIFFLYQAVTDTGCCGSQGCQIPKHQNKQQVEEVEYEEVR